MRAFLVAAMLLLTLNARAGGVEPDKLSHALGSVVAGGIGTWISDYYWPEHRLAAGFGLGLIPGLAGEIIDEIDGPGFSSGDMVANVIGSAVGALITDKLILRPVVRVESTAVSLGVVVEGQF